MFTVNGAWQRGDAGTGGAQDSSRVPESALAEHITLDETPPGDTNNLSRMPGAFEPVQSSNIVARKKLPWLDATRARSVPALNDRNAAGQKGKAFSVSAPIPPDMSRAVRGNTKLDTDEPHGSGQISPAINPKPSLRASMRAPGQTVLPHAAHQNLSTAAPMSDPSTMGSVVAQPPTVASSEYSTTQSDSRTLSPPTLAKLVPSPLANRPAPLFAINRWLQSELDLPLDSPDLSPKEEVAPAAKKIAPGSGLSMKERTGRTPQGEHHAQGRKSDTGQELDDMSHTRSVAGRGPTLEARAPDLSWIRPLQPLERSATLRNLPPHLVSGGSSSTSREAPPKSLQQRGLAASLDLGRRPASLSRAVSGLENLMGEALNVAKGAANSGHSDEVADILNNASLALKNAGSVQRTLQKPHRASSSISETSLDSNSSTIIDAKPSAETLPTVYTKSASPSMRPLVNEAFVRGSHRPRSHKARRESTASAHDSISPTPPRLYQPASADSMIRDFAYLKQRAKREASSKSGPPKANYGEAAAYYEDQGQSVETQPGVRKSLQPGTGPEEGDAGLRLSRPNRRRLHPARRGRGERLRELEPTPDNGEIPERTTTFPTALPSSAAQHHPHHWFQHISQGPSKVTQAGATVRGGGAVGGQLSGAEQAAQRRGTAQQGGSVVEHRPSEAGRHHISLEHSEGLSLGRRHKHQPIAREWNLSRKRVTAMIACLNTIFVGLIAGIYAGEVPRIQYQLADQSHWVITGNVLLFSGLALSTLIFWPLPLLHGRKPYTLLSFACMLPLQFPQAITVDAYRQPDNAHRVGLLLPRFFTGFALGFANINTLPTLFDLFGASLCSARPHQEFVVVDDVRRQGGGLGVWLGVWVFCFTSSLSIGFAVGAGIISSLGPSWGFYITVMLLAFFLLVNVIAPETRRAAYRRSIAQFSDNDDAEEVKRRVVRGEVKLHISNDGPKWWFEEVWAGLVLMKRLALQPGFFILMWYLAWVTAELNLIILFLGALLSRSYQWRSGFVGLAVLAIPVGALLALPLTKASWFSRSRVQDPRTDSMTFQPRITWTSHLLRRTVFTILLPFAGLGYCLSAVGPPLTWVPAVIFAGFLGFLTDLGIAECIGLIMETFDTCDLQPGVNTRHRLQSMSTIAQRRHTNYSSFPRVCAAFFLAQGVGFFLSAAATGVSGVVTRIYGAQTAIAVVAAIVLGVTLLLLSIMWRWKQVQVIPSFTTLGATPAGPTTLGRSLPGPSTARASVEEQGTARGGDPDSVTDAEWKAVIIGNPSGKLRRMNILEMGRWTRWTEIRKLNKLIPD